MDVQKPKRINNDHFKVLCEVIREVIGEYTASDSEIVSTMIDASLDDHDKANPVYLYNELKMNLEVVKPDSLTQYLKNVLNLKEKPANEVPAADALCIDAQNEWYIFEFKNSDLTSGKDDNTKKSIRKKMLNTIWFLFFLYSKSQHSIIQEISDDVIEFSRKHITYIIVGSSRKNARYMDIIRQSFYMKQSFTPPAFQQYVGYYFKDVYMLTEKELRSFIRDFKS